MNQEIISRRLQVLIGLYFVVFAAWWLYLTIVVRSSDHSSLSNQLFAGSYGITALLGGIAGLLASKKWGGTKSLMGRALLFFSIGLLAQEFGQVAYSYYSYVLRVDIPYPSVGDIGYFASVLFYIYAALQLAKATGVQISLKDRSPKIIAVVLPLILLLASYAVFLQDYQFDFSSFKAAITVFLDFGYPFGQAIYIGIALVTYLLSQKMLGGVMKNKILFVLFALFVQYVADFSYLYAAKAEKAFPGGANDFVYLLAYAAMAWALTQFCKNLTAGPAAKTKKIHETGDEL